MNAYNPYMIGGPAVLLCISGSPFTSLWQFPVYKMEAEEEPRRPLHTCMPSMSITHLVALDTMVSVHAWRVAEAEVQGGLSAGHEGTAVQPDGALQKSRLHGGGGLLVAVVVGGGQGIPREAGLVERG